MSGRCANLATDMATVGSVGRKRGYAVGATRAKIGTSPTDESIIGGTEGERGREGGSEREEGESGGRRTSTFMRKEVGRRGTKIMGMSKGHESWNIFEDDLIYLC